MDKHLILETTTVIDGTAYIVRSIVPNKDDVKVIKSKVRKLIINNVKNIEKQPITSGK